MPGDCAGSSNEVSNGRLGWFPSRPLCAAERECVTGGAAPLCTQPGKWRPALRVDSRIYKRRRVTKLSVCRIYGADLTANTVTIQTGKCIRNSRHRHQAASLGT